MTSTYFEVNINTVSDVVILGDSIKVPDRDIDSLVIDKGDFEETFVEKSEQEDKDVNNSRLSNRKHCDC